MSGQFSKALIELARQMRLIDFIQWGDGWKCDHCITVADNFTQAKKHSDTHKKLEKFDIRL